MSRATVRPIRREDLARVWEMVHGLAEFEKLEDILTGSAEALARALFESPPFLYGIVAEHEGRLVGYALYHYTFSSFRTNPRMWLEDLYVEPEARGTGAGASLLRAFARDALARGCHRIDWHVLDWNPAREFYERMGAKPSTDGWTQFGMDAEAMRALLEPRP
jgi:GNAT superfamily N-acetyltransferase